MSNSTSKYTLSDRDLQEIQNPNDFQSKYIYRYGRVKQDVIDRGKEIEGRRFWVSGLRGNSGNSVQRNQVPIEIVIFINSEGFIEFRTLRLDGTPASKKVNLFDNAGNGLHICETKIQAQYMYNKDLDGLMTHMDLKIREIECVKERLASFELNIGI